jgi:predicted permease
MRPLKRFLTRLTRSVTRQDPEERIQEEVKEHLALLTAENLREGLSPVEARRRAVLKFGAVEAVKEDYRDQHGLLFLETLFQDTRHAMRRLRKNPVFTLTAILTLALGIGATTSIFTLVHAVLLKSLPVSNPDQLVRLGKDPACCVQGGYFRGEDYSLVSYELYTHFRDNTAGFEEMAAFQADGTFLGIRRAHDAHAAESYFGEFVSGNYFSMFGVSAYAGRALTMSDDKPGAVPAAIMSYRVWQQKYELDSSVIGSVFNINGKPFTVVGVTPPGFFGDTLKTMPPDFFLPLATEPLIQGEESSLLRHADASWLDIIGRLRPGADMRTVEAQMRVELHQWLRSHLSDMYANAQLDIPKQTLYLTPGGAGITTMRQQYEDWLQVLMIASGLVLLIVCANVANLMLVRGLERRQQMSLSMALGAGPMRLVRQALTESVVLSLLGGALGLAVAFAGTRLILHLAFETTTAVPISVSPSIPVLLFAFGISLVTGVIFGIAPAWMATHADPVEALRGAIRSTLRVDSLPRKTLVVLQAALSLVLLFAAGLLTTALRNLEHQNFGFEQEGRTVMHIDPLLAGYKPEQLQLLYRRIHDAFLNIPGVVSVACVQYAPLSGDSWSEPIHVEGKPALGSSADNEAWWARVVPGFFEVIGNHIVKGRPINEQDTAGAPHVAVINEAFARRFFNNEDPIGKHFGKGGMKYATDYEIVGVARDARYLTYNLDKPVGPFFFLPNTQSTSYTNPFDLSSEVRSHYLHDIVVRTKLGATLPEVLARRTMASVDPNLPIVRMQTLAEQMANTFSQPRLIARLTSLFGILALVLASIGVYGITAYNVGSRTNEIGVRVALGADRRNVVALILRGSFFLIALGLLLGVPLALDAGGFLGSQLYGVNRYDPLVLSAASFTLGLSALVAALIPAYRGSSISPMQALRAE